MHLIQRSAYVYVCIGCRQHARIVYTDGSRSLNFGSRETGLDIIDQSLKDRKVSSEEAYAVIEQIMTSPLPTERGVVDEIIDELREASKDAGLPDIEVFVNACSPTRYSVRNN